MPSKKINRKERITSPEVEGLVKWLQDKKILGEVMLQKHDEPVESGGNYDPEDKSIAAVAGAVNEGNSTVLHEVTHALRRSGIKTTAQKFYDYYEQLSPLGLLLDKFSGKGLMLPKSYKDGMVGAPLIPGKKGEQFHVPFQEGGRAGKYGRETAKRRWDEAVAAVPEDQSWSGLRKGQKHMLSPRRAEEGQSYYLTAPEVARPLKERAKEFGMFLGEYGVPMDIIEGVVKELGEGKNIYRNKRVTGGYLKQVRNEYRKRRTE